jgi:hypothetical protein
MGLASSYLSKIDWAHGFPLDIVEIKLRRLLTELKSVRGQLHFLDDLYPKGILQRRDDHRTR